MTRYEQEFMAIVPNALRDIAKELKKMNKLKALELKGKAGRDFNVSIEAVDDIMADKDN